MWYRKTFKLPKEWSVSDTIKRSPSIWLDFGGIFRVSTVYVNGVNVSYHICGYTGFQVQRSVFMTHQVKILLLCLWIQTMVIKVVNDMDLVGGMKAVVFIAMLAIYTVQNPY